MAAREGTKYLLSIDGGGLRGIIPACQLVKLERTTGKLTREIFSFVAGTSTGAIIAAGVAAGIPAERILNLYRTRAREIFPSRPWNLLLRIARGWMYSPRTLHRILTDELAEAAHWRVNDSPIDVLITSKRLVPGVPWYFVRDNQCNACSTGHLPLLDCVVASAAAPTFFKPWRIRGASRRPDADPGHMLIDGGVGVTGNPVYQACVEAFYHSDQYRPEQTIVVSLGTGRHLHRSEPAWLGAWVEWLLAELLRSPGEQQTEFVHRLFPNLPLYRIDVELKRDIPLDEAGAVGELEAVGRRLAERVDWPAILAGEDRVFRVHDANMRWHQYRKEV